MADDHATPQEGSECAACMDDLTVENYVEYRQMEGGPWMPSKYCQTCIEEMLKRKWNDYKEGIVKTDCAAEWKRLVDRGPPVNLRDPTGLPCPDDGEVHSLWYASDGEVHTAKLEGSLVGEERQAYWDHLLAFRSAVVASSTTAGEDKGSNQGNDEA